ncbi:Stk1 family PASTA domain-containing Ser/Thr kinase [Corynebacterium falsenii]|uniref:Stk1 family PASTA domain-containing Ser/Thr kinase n=1 Tax=Corynebacterium falsenii TaxID=108486 RepID=UPI001CCB4977|nr:Stk1 family PASTA domain-containing Ser/Thr kinase [Corynebacterium falsenii]UBI07032.1 Stk1 family PASTA domain-containing Ser/Thr kinase [Corynebacterium falsenii]
MDRTGTTLGGRYRLGAKIGTGGMSDVYAAEDELLGRDVAVKMMRPDLARDTTFLERFRREAQNAAKLNHPAIVAVYDTGQTPDNEGAVPYIVMERVHGETLREIVQESGKMRLNDAANVMSQVCSALHFSHEAGIIHRDIKPANIMITNTGAVKVMDFGIARALSDSSAAMTQTAAVIGTAQYLSPEQARGKSADARSDIYAAGCVFYELATGQPPFKGESPFSVAFQHVQDEPQLPSQLPGMHLSKREALSLDSIVLTAMAKNPADRYDDAQEMSTDLGRLANDQLPLVAQAYTSNGEGNGGAHATSVLPAAGAAGLAGAAGAAGFQPPEYAEAAARDGDKYPGNAYPNNPYTDNPYNGDYNDFEHYEGDESGGYEDYDTDEGYQDYEEERPRRRPWVPLLWILALLLLIGGGIFAYTAFTDGGDGSSSSSQEQIRIPDVANKSREDATKALESAGFDVNTEDRNDDVIPRGKAVGTHPAANATAPKGSTITLFISSGKEITDVPDLTGMTTEQASRTLKDARLELNSEVKEEASATVPSGQVITQNPPQGSQVSVGTKVTITVSTGPEDVRVPMVKGQNVDAARQNLEAAGFQVTVQQVDSPEPEGRVISASSEGQRLPKGSQVTLQVSKGNQFQMPSLQGKKFSEVDAALRAAGWQGSPSQLQRRDVKTPDVTRTDEVTQQSVKAGQVINKDQPITVDVYVFSLLP